MPNPNRWGDFQFPGLYYIHTFTGVGKDERTGLYRTCMDAVMGGCRLIQLRLKGPFGPTVSEILRLMIADFEGSETRFLMNDRAEWALAVGAHGVHVGEEGDSSVVEARQLLGSQALIGATTKTPAQLAAALSADVDYVSWGALFESSTKPEAIPGSLDGIATLKAQLPELVRLCVIGGITEDRIPQVMKQPGVDLIAVGAAIQRAADPELATLKLVDAIRLATPPS